MSIEAYGISTTEIEIYKDGKPFLDIVFSEELESFSEAQYISENIVETLNKLSL